MIDVGCGTPVPQSHIKESTTNEITVYYPNQEQTTARTHGSLHHSLPMTTNQPPEPPSAPPQIIPQDTSQPPSNSKPANWNQMSASAQMRWRQRQKHKEK